MAENRDIFKELSRQGIIIQAKGRGTIAEEMPEAYKDVSDVVDAVQGAGISKKVVKLRPLGVVKGGTNPPHAGPEFSIVFSLRRETSFINLAMNSLTLFISLIVNKKVKSSPRQAENQLEIRSYWSMDACLRRHDLSQ